MAVPTAELKPSVPSSPLLGFWNTFRKNRMGTVGLIMLVVIVFIAVFAPVLAPYDPKSFEGIISSDVYLPPSPEHWFGTDDAGKDVLSSFMYGARVSLIVGFIAAFISIIIGGVIGIVAGFYRGRTENLLIRVRFDRLTPREKQYLRAMAHLGPGAQRTSDIADTL